MRKGPRNTARTRNPTIGNGFSGTRERAGNVGAVFQEAKTGTVPHGISFFRSQVEQERVRRGTAPHRN